MRPTITRDKKKPAFVPFTLSLRFETLEEAVRVRDVLGELVGEASTATYDIFDVLDDEVITQQVGD